MIGAVAQMLIWGSAIAVLACLAVAGYGVVARYRGRPVPGWVVPGAAALFGISSGAVLPVGVDPVAHLASLVAPAIVALLLLADGRRVAAGWLGLGTGLPATAVWLLYAVAGGVALLWWALAGFALTAGGALLTRIGDRPKPLPGLLPSSARLPRDPTPLGNGIQRALAVGPVALPTVVALVPSMIVISLLVPALIGVGVPWPLAGILGTVAFGLGATEVWFLALPRRVRRAWEGFAVVGNRELRRWKETVGTPVPTSEPEVRHWLTVEPERPETRGLRAELLGVIGEFDAARAAIATMPESTPAQRMERLSLAQYVDWIAGGDPDFGEQLRLAEEVGSPDSVERQVARGHARIAIARDLAVRGGDWMGALTEIADDAGPVAGQLLREDLWRSIFTRFVLLGAAMSALSLLVSGGLA